MPDEQLTSEELQEQFNAQLIDAVAQVMADMAVWATADPPHEGNWEDNFGCRSELTIARSVIERYEFMRGGARVDFSVTSSPANMIVLPGATNGHGVEVTHPYPLDKLLPGIVAGWKVQIYGKVVDGNILDGEINVVISNASVQNRNTVRLADLAAAIVARQSFEAAHQAKTEQKEGGE